jgi:hypothetical protein
MSATTVAFLCGGHPRCGKESPLSVLPTYVLQNVVSFLDRTKTLLYSQERKLLLVARDGAEKCAAYGKEHTLYYQKTDHDELSYTYASPNRTAFIAEAPDGECLYASPAEGLVAWGPRAAMSDALWQTVASAGNSKHSRYIDERAKRIQHFDKAARRWTIIERPPQWWSGVSDIGDLIGDDRFVVARVDGDGSVSPADGKDFVKLPSSWALERLLPEMTAERPAKRAKR